MVSDWEPLECVCEHTLLPFLATVVLYSHPLPRPLKIYVKSVQSRRFENKKKQLYFLSNYTIVYTDILVLMNYIVNICLKKLRGKQKGYFVLVKIELEALKRVAK